MSEFEDCLRQSVVACAREYLYETDSSCFWQDVCPSIAGSTAKLAWCGAFALHVLRKCGLTDWHWVLRKGFIWCDDNGRNLKAPRLPITRNPKPGDIAYFNLPFQHYAIVIEQTTMGAAKRRAVHLIAGNTPDVDESVADITKPVFFSIQPLIAAKASQSTGCNVGSV